VLRIYDHNILAAVLAGNLGQLLLRPPSSELFVRIAGLDAASNSLDRLGNDTEQRTNEESHDSVECCEDTEVRIAID